MLGELSTLLVFNIGEESHPSSIRSYFSLAAAICPEIQFSATPASCKKSNRLNHWSDEGEVNISWKAEEVSYLFGIWILVRFQMEQHHISIFWLLLAVNTELTPLSDFSHSEVLCWIERSYGVSKTFTPIRNLATYPHNLFVMIPFVITFGARS
jgi:hypothetical protein